MRHHQTVVLRFNEDRVLTLSEFAINAGISLVTLRRAGSLIDSRSFTNSAASDSP
jgi:hypothetical protein